MRQAAEVHCYLCGEIAGIWEWLATAPPEFGLFRPRSADRPITRGWLQRLRCPRCGGSVYLDDVAPVKARESFGLDEVGPPRRGRPRKYKALAS
jgi:hypothetical protein